MGLLAFRGDSRSCRTDIGEFPFQIYAGGISKYGSMSYQRNMLFTFLELLQALESDLKLVGRKERSRVVEEFNPKERDD